MLNPGFIFPPADLEYFIQYEKADQDRRREIGRRTGTIPTRISPTAESYRNHQIEAGEIPSDACGGAYMRFTLRDYFPKLGQLPFVPGASSFPGPKPWHGAPMAALRRAFLVLGSPFLQGIPKETKHMLRTLLDLYSDEISDNDVVERDGYNSIDEPSEDEERRNNLLVQQVPDASRVLPTARSSNPPSHPREGGFAIRHSSTPLAEVQQNDLQAQQHWWGPCLTSEDVVKLSERISRRGHMKAGNYIMSLTRTHMRP